MAHFQAPDEHAHDDVDIGHVHAQWAANAHDYIAKCGRDNDALDAAGQTRLDQLAKEQAARVARHARLQLAQKEALAQKTAALAEQAQKH